MSSAWRNSCHIGSVIKTLALDEEDEGLLGVFQQLGESGCRGCHGSDTTMTPER